MDAQAQSCRLIDGPKRDAVWMVGVGVKRLLFPVFCGGCADCARAGYHNLVYTRVHETGEGVAIFSCDPDFTATEAT